MLTLAAEIEAVTRPKLEFLARQLDVQPATHQIQKLLTFVRVRIAGAFNPCTRRK
jgi:hypothetical protein